MTGAKKQLLVELGAIDRQVAPISHGWIGNVLALNTAPQRLVERANVERVLPAEILARGHLLPVGGVVERDPRRVAKSSIGQWKSCGLRQIGVQKRLGENRVVGPGPRRHFKD